MAATPTQYQIQVEFASGSYDYAEKSPPSILRLATLVGEKEPETPQVFAAVMRAREMWDAIYEGCEREAQTVSVDLVEISPSEGGEAKQAVG